MNMNIFQQPEEPQESLTQQPPSQQLSPPPPPPFQQPFAPAASPQQVPPPPPPPFQRTLVPQPHSQQLFLPSSPPSQQLLTPPPPPQQSFIPPSTPQTSKPLELQDLQEYQNRLEYLLREYTQEQIRLYFFPYPERQHQALMQRLIRWLCGLGGLVVLLFIIYGGMVGSQQGLTAGGVFGSLLSVGLIILIIWLAVKYVWPLWKLYRFEYTEHVKEQQHLATHRPPTDQQYSNWIDRMGTIVYKIAEEKLHLPESKVHKDWREWREKTGEERGPRPEKRKEYEADLRVMGFEPPADDKIYLLHHIKRNNQDAVIVTSNNEIDHNQPLRRGNNYSVNIFTRLFVTKDFITIYSNTINVRQPDRIQEASEHFYHQHLTHVSMKVDGNKIGKDMVMLQELTLMLDSGHTIPLNVARAIFSYKRDGQVGEVSDIDSVHGGLIRALYEHKMSSLESNVQADKVKEASSMIEDETGMQY